MIDISFSSNIIALTAQVAILAQASIVCLLVLVNLPTTAVTSILGKCSIIVVWAAVVTNTFIDFPDNLDLWLNGFALFLTTTHLIKCFALRKTIQRYSAHPLKSYLMTLLFGVLHSERWQRAKQY